MTAIKVKDRDSLINSLRAGVVPKVGQHLIQVGRKGEMDAFLADINMIQNQGSSFRIVIGNYGAGKTFFLNLIRSIAVQQRLVTMHADLTPDRRLHSSGGQARSLYVELVKSMSTRSKPDGGALSGVVEKFISDCKVEAASRDITASEIIHEKLKHIKELVGGYDFATVISTYCEGFEEGREELMDGAIRWLKGEFSTKTEAKNFINVRNIIDDQSVYDHIKLLARFIKLAGYGGLVVCLDEMVNLYKLSNTQARNSNYEQILRILNDTLQGASEGIGFILGGTPEFLTDTRRGLYSYEALKSRLAENAFATDGLVDYSGPIMRLSNLSQDDFYVLLEKIRHVYASGDHAKYLIPDAAIKQFMHHCANQLGNNYFKTPRNVITSFINMLAILEQNPGESWGDLIGAIEVKPDSDGVKDLELDRDVEFAHFKL